MATLVEGDLGRSEQYFPPVRHLAYRQFYVL
jgi:hypothetical protein